MRKQFAVLAAALALSLTGTLPVLAAEDVPVESGEALHESSVLIVDGSEKDSRIRQKDADAMYRLYNPNSGEHFYTADAEENKALVSLGWQSEGIGWYAPKQSETPVFRLYNPYAGDHHYTTSTNERDGLTASGWIYEKIGWYSADEGGQPVYRQYNPNAVSGTHNYTVNENEDKGLAAAGWVQEGIGWYGESLSCPTNSIVQQLSRQLKDYQQLLKQDRSANANLDGLRDQGLAINTILNAFSKQFENRYFVFSGGSLVGYSGIGDNAVPLSVSGPGDYLILQTQERKAQTAGNIADSKLQGDALYYRTTGGSTQIRAAAGNVVNGLLEGNTAGYVYIEEPNNAYEEYSFGPAAGNLLNGVIHKHTRYFKSSVTSLSEFDWTIEVDKGKAKYDKIGDYYYVCRSPQVNVYYDYIPENLSFWPSR